MHAINEVINEVLISTCCNDKEKNIIYFLNILYFQIHASVVKIQSDATAIWPEKPVTCVK